MYLLDTNICIYLMKGTYPNLTEKVFAHPPTEFAISAVTAFELEYGAAKSNWGEKSRNNMKMFLAPFTIIPFNSVDAAVAGELRGYLEQQGTPIGPYDIQIAAQGLARNFIVITHNVDEFSRVPNLLVDDWTIE